MIIFIDTNLIYGNWHLQNANFKYLLNYLENTTSTLAVSEIVCDEIDNKFLIELESNKFLLKNTLKKVGALVNKNIDFDLKILDKSYSFMEVLQDKTDQVIFYPYDSIKNEEIVKRAIKKVKPFKDEDKGYRDTLIWLSFLAFLKKNNTENVAFINNNSSDFYNQDKTDLHDDLKNDINFFEIKNSFQVFESIKDFIDKEVGTKHKYTANTIMEEFIYPNEFLIEEMLESYINSQSPKWFTELMKNHSRAFNKLAFLTNFSFHIVEGIEDPDLLNWEPIEDNSFFGELLFFLRIVELKFTVPKIVYESNKLSFSETEYSVELNNEYAIVTTFKKIYMNISFNYDTENKIVENLEINMFGPM